MSVIFKPRGAAPANFIIGGQSTLSSDTGVVGPQPNINISKEVFRSDVITINHKYTITVTGTALIEGSADPLVSGARQNEIHKIITKLSQASQTIGVLEIAPYGGQTEVLKFNDARLTSVDIPEQDEQSSGTQFQNYTFNFEAYTKTSDGDGQNSGDLLAGVSEISESWEISLQEGTYSRDWAAPANNTELHKTWTVTHTVSATGFGTWQSPASPASSDMTTGHNNAKNWVESRLTSNPILVNPKDLNPYPATNEDDIDFSLPEDVGGQWTKKAFNHVRQISQDVVAGSYSVTDSWVVGGFAATHDVQFSLNKDITAEFNTVELSITVQGLESVDTYPASQGRPTTSAYANALTDFTALKSVISTMVNAFYSTTGLTGTIRSGDPTSQSESHNETSGQITYSATFDDNSVTFPNALSETLTITYDNDHDTVGAGNDITVVIPVLAKADGPVIQFMGTTQEKKVSVSLEVQMDEAYRTNKPDKSTVDSYLTGYSLPPTSSNANNPTFQNSKSETWNPKSGSYSVSIEWAYV